MATLLLLRILLVLLDTGTDVSRNETSESCHSSTGRKINRHIALITDETLRLRVVDHNAMKIQTAIASLLAPVAEKASRRLGTYQFWPEILHDVSRKQF